MTDKSILLTWDVKFPLLTNPHIVKAWVKAMAITYLFCMVILGPVLIATGETDGLPPLALAFLAVLVGLTLLGFLIMLVVFGNRSQARFVLSEKGVVYESVDNKAKNLSRMAVLAGSLLGSPTTAGAGLLSISKERIDLSWAAVFEARYDEKNRTIRLRNQYRDLLHLYCASDTFSTVRDIVRSKVGRKGGQNGYAEQRSPLPGALISTLLVIASCMPLYALVDIAKLHMMIPLLIMVFGLAMIWMIPLFAWVVLPLAAYIPAYLGWALTRSSTLQLVSTYSFRKYELLDGGEWIIICLAAAGLAYLSRISIKSLKGRYVPVLMRDRPGV